MVTKTLILSGIRLKYKGTEVQSSKKGLCVYVYVIHLLHLHNVVYIISGFGKIHARLSDVVGIICSPYGQQCSASLGYLAVCTAIFYCIHQMVIHNATKLLPIRSQTKLIVTVTLTLTDTVTVIFFMRTSLTPIKRFYHIYERNFSRRCVAGFVSGAIFCTTQQLYYPFADVAILSSENTSDKK